MGPAGYAGPVPRGLIIGGTGLLGRATGRRLRAAGGRVDLSGRDPGHLPADIAAAGGPFVAADRDDPGQLLTAPGDGADLLVDCTGYAATDAAALLPLRRSADATEMISSTAEYVDSAGRHVTSTIAPTFEGPIRERQPTVPPGEGGYAERKVAAERVLLDDGGPVTVVRPALLHGAGARMPREWVFVTRALDRPPVLHLAQRGAGVVQTTAAATAAALIEAVAARPGRRILNSADPDALSAREIARTIARPLDHVVDEVRLDDGADRCPGRPPRDAPHPIVLDMTVAGLVGSIPVGDDTATGAEAVGWLVPAARGGADAAILDQIDGASFGPRRDDAAEDRHLAAGG